MMMGEGACADAIQREARSTTTAQKMESRALPLVLTGRADPCGLLVLRELERGLDRLCLAEHEVRAVDVDFDP